MARAIAIRGDSIRLGQLLKLAGVADTGSDAKAMLADGVVRVNGAPETRRGRRLGPGDVVAVGTDELTVAAAGSADGAPEPSAGSGGARPG